MIQFEIFPYLTWDDRNAVNSCLPPIDRIRTPLAKDSGVILAMRIQAAGLKKKLTNVESSTSLSQKVRHIVKTFREIDKYSYLIMYHKDFRNMILEKCRNYSNPENPEYVCTSKYVKKTLIKYATNFLKIYEEKYPYKYEINPYKDASWNPIQNRYVALEKHLKN